MTHIRLSFPARSLLVAVLALSALPSCDRGHITEDIGSIDQRDISGIALPGDDSKRTAINFVPRAMFGADNAYANLGYPGLSQQGQDLMVATDPNSPIHFFITPHTDAEGVGPLFNQRRCLGCHLSQEDIKANNLSTGGTTQFPAGAAGNTFTTLNTVNTPFSRAARQGPTDYRYIHNNFRPNTAAFTLFGDYFPASGGFDPISILGGPLQHVQATAPPAGSPANSCESLELPGLNSDPNLQGGIDPATGLSVLGARREVGQRAGPPYIGRGLMEAVYFGDILANEDLLDQTNATETCLSGGAPPNGLKECSSLPPAADHSICPGDCVSGRHNESSAASSMIGGDPVVRVGRFGLRATGTTMLQFDVGGTQGEIGLTSIFFPTEQPYPDGTGQGCDQVPDPEITAQDNLNLRAMIRLFGPPDYPAELRQNPPGSQLAMDIQAGARLFGVDLNAFLSRTTKGQAPVNPGDFDADRGMATDRMLNCVACHIPILKTGVSPASIDNDQLTNKWAPIFSDLMLHENPRYPEGFSNDSITWSEERFVAQVYPYFFPQMAGTSPLNRNLADFAIPGSVTGLAYGAEFRTAPLMGLGKTGPPLLHDARVYVNITQRTIQTFPADDPTPRMGQGPGLSTFPNDKDVDPNAPRVAANQQNLYILPGSNPPIAYPGPIDGMAITVTTSADGGVNMPLVVDSVDNALLAAIELHDLPAPPHVGAGGPVYPDDYANCAKGQTAANDLCARNSRNRGEARNTIEKFHLLTKAQQLQVVRFLESL